MTQALLLADRSVQDFDALHDELPAWRDAIEALITELGGGTVVQVTEGPVGEPPALAPPWEGFLRVQRARCLSRQQRTGLPAHLLQQLEAFLDPRSLVDLALGPCEILAGEYTPMYLLVQGDRLSGRFDFGDGLLGPRAYDWLGPLCFLAAGEPARCRAFLSACGATLDDALRLRLMRLLLLHRYSHLPAQLALAGGQQRPDFESLARALWP